MKLYFHNEDGLFDSAEQERDAYNAAAGMEDGNDMITSIECLEDGEDEDGFYVIEP